MTVAAADLAGFFIYAGEVVGGGTAFIGSLSFVVGSVLRDLGFKLDLRRWTERGAQLGGVAGLTALVLHATG